MRILSNVKRFLFPTLGVICILFAEHITLVLPYLLGGAMVIVGVLIGINCLHGRRFLNQHSDESAHGVVMLIMGIAFIIQGANALGPLGTTWAVIGIRKASKSLNQAIRQIYRKKHFLAPILEFLIRISLALILLFDPFEKFSTHVVILGLELIATSFPFTKSFPPTRDTVVS